MATSNRTSSVSGVVEELAVLYPEMDSKSLKNLFQKPPLPTVKTESTRLVERNEDTNSRPSAEKTIEVVQIDTSSESDCDVVEHYLKTKATDATLPKQVNLNNEVFWMYRTPTPLKFGKMRTFRTPLSVEMDSGGKEDVGSVAYENHFLSCLSEIYAPCGSIVRNEEAVLFVKEFRKRKDALIYRLLETYNKHIFDNKLPEDLKCTWNVRMTKTAGFCKYTIEENSKRTAHIELSSKVCDNAERVRDTLIHEMCHAAAWILHGHRGGHDAVWKYWARQAGRVFPALPVIRRCHAYEIHAKFVYTCTTCGRQVRRHTKSLDVETKGCGFCQGRFELSEDKSRASSSSTSAINSTPNPRPTPKFALFVKSHYSEIKGKTPQATHREIMRSLGEEFKKLDFDDDCCQV